MENMDGYKSIHFLNLKPVKGDNGETIKKINNSINKITENVLKEKFTVSFPKNWSL